MDLSKYKIDFAAKLTGTGASQAQVILFLRHLGVMLKAGLAISESLGIIAEQSKGRMKRTVEGIMKSIDSGGNLSDSLAEYPNIFSEHIISTCRAGEISGHLEENLLLASAYMERRRELKNKVKNAMFYPAIVMGLAVGLGLSISYYILPKITPLFDSFKSDLPLSTKILIQFSKIMKTNGIWLVLGILFFVLFSVLSLKSRKVKPFTHKVLLKMPYVGAIARSANLSDFTRTLGMLIKSGLNIDEALEVSANSIGNYYYQKSLIKILDKVREGNPLAESMENESGYFPKIVSSMVRVGEKSGNLDESLVYLADLFDNETDRAVKIFSTAVEPALLIIVGLAVAWLSLAIITPMYSITSMIK